MLVLRIQPNVGVFFQFNTKDFSAHNGIVPTKMDTSSFSPTRIPEAYERLIYDCEGMQLYSPDGMRLRRLG